MGVAMAGMLVPRLRVFWAGGWEVIFGVPRPSGSAGWRSASTRAGRRWARFRPHHAQHAPGCAAMVYMFAAVTDGRRAERVRLPGMSGMGGAPAFPTLALVFALALFGYVVWTADRLPGPGPGLAPWTAPPGAIGRRGRGRAARARGRGSLARHRAAAGRRSRRGRTQPVAALARHRGLAGPPLSSPRLAACCEIAMGVTMGSC